MYGRELHSGTRGANSALTGVGYGCGTLNGDDSDVATMFSSHTGVSNPVNSAEMTVEDHELLMQMCPENQVPDFSMHATSVSVFPALAIYFAQP